VSFTAVMTVFLRPDLLMPALFHVAAQDYPHWDLAVYADGPHPRAEAIFREAVAGKPALAARARYTTCPRGEGLWGNRARRRGLDEATGDYTVFIGHDCVVMPGYLAAHAENIAASPGCLSLVEVEFWKDRDTYDPARRLAAPRYFGVWPAPAGKPLDALGPLDGVDLLSLAFPTAAARRLGVFGAAVEHRYGADYLAYVACRGAMPVVHRPGVVAGHF
jgi:GT2 family glycosyltransferase